MAKGLPWVGSGGRPPNPRDQYAPAPGSLPMSDARVEKPTVIDTPNTIKGGATSSYGRTQQDDSNAGLHESLRKPGLMR